MGSQAPELAVLQADECRPSATRADVAARSASTSSISQAGDHFQVGFNVDGHGGDKYYVTPYVGLFVADPDKPQQGAKATSRTSAKYAVSSRKRGSVKVTVSSRKAATGAITVMDGRRAIGRAVLKPSHRGVVTVKVPKLREGKHRLQVKYLGSPTVKPSASPVKTVTVR